MNRLSALLVFVIFIAAGCELGTDAVDESVYWWLDDPAFAHVLHKIDADLTLQLNDPNLVVLTPEAYSGAEMRDNLIEMLGVVGYHHLVWHPEVFDEVHTARSEVEGSVGLDSTTNNVTDYPDCPCIDDCFPGHGCGDIDCEGGGGGGGAPPPDPPFTFDGTTFIYNSTSDPNIPVWDITLVSTTHVTSNHRARIIHEACLNQSGAEEVCNYNPYSAFRPNGPRRENTTDFQTNIEISGRGLICPHRFSGVTYHWAQKKTFWGHGRLKREQSTASGGPFC